MHPSAFLIPFFAACLAACSSANVRSASDYSPPAAPPVRNPLYNPYAAYGEANATWQPPVWDRDGTIVKPPNPPLRTIAHPMSSRPGPPVPPAAANSPRPALFDLLVVVAARSRESEPPGLLRYPSGWPILLRPRPGSVVLTRPLTLSKPDSHPAFTAARKARYREGIHAN